MKIYTKTGDKGETALFGGSRVPKYHPRVDAYGAIDEANAQIGLLVAQVKDAKITALLESIQGNLFEIGAILANPNHTKVPLKNSHIDALEDAIDYMYMELPELRTFILPGGTQVASCAHVCRCIIRRAERRVVELSTAQHVHGIIIRYLNRLSDYFFTLARYLNHQSGVKDIPWHTEG